jgi:lauroyl/myristoyl acyltransferase
MGAFEPSIALLRKFESRIHVLFHPDPLPRFERARSALRQSLGIIEHAVSDGVSAWAALQDALRANEVVVLHADRVMPMQQGSRIPFLGAHDTVLPTGAARLALACGAPIVPTFCYRHGHELEVEMMAPIYCEVESLRSSEVASHPAQLALVAALETAIRKHPSQWMAFMQVREARK